MRAVVCQNASLQLVDLPEPVPGSANIELTGLLVPAPGAYAEHVVVEESLTLSVPNGLSSDHAALTEPMAVGWHAQACGIEAAFSALGDPEKHAKILIDPKSLAATA